MSSGQKLQILKKLRGRSKSPPRKLPEEKPPTPPPIEENEFLEEEEEEDPDKELQEFEGRLKKIGGIMGRLSSSLAQLRLRYSDSEIAEILSGRRNKQKDAEAIAFVKSQKEIKRLREQNHKRVREEELQRRRRAEQRKRKARQKDKAELMAERKKQQSKRKQQRAKEDEEARKKEEEAKKILDKFKIKDPLYKRWERKARRKEKKQKQVEKKFLEKRGENFKPIELEDLKAHQMLHDAQTRESLEYKQKEKAEKHQNIVERNQELLKKLYRGKTYAMVQQEEDEKFDYKLKAASQRERVKRYQSYVKENFKPEVEEKSDEEEEQEEPEDEDSQQEFNLAEAIESPKMRRVKRYKFVQGEACGQVTEVVKAPYSQKLQRRVGDSYLQQLYHLPKKKKSVSPPKEDANNSEPNARSRVQIPRLPRPKHFSVVVSDKPHRSELETMMALLKGRDKQVELKRKHLGKPGAGQNDKQALIGELGDDMIGNIERKLSMLNQL